MFPTRSSPEAGSSRTVSVLNIQLALILLHLESGFKILLSRIKSVVCSQPRGAGKALTEPWTPLAAQTQPLCPDPEQLRGPRALLQCQDPLGLLPKSSTQLCQAQRRSWGTKASCSFTHTQSTAESICWPCSLQSICSQHPKLFPCTLYHTHTVLHHSDWSPDKTQNSPNSWHATKKFLLQAFSLLTLCAERLF